MAGPLPARVTMPLGRHGLPQVELGRYNHTRAHPGLVDHAHHSTLEICYLVKGRQTYRVGGRAYQLRGGDLFLTFPDEPHSTGVAPEEKGRLFWMQVRLPRRGQSFLGLPPRPGRALRAGLLGIRSRHFSGSPRMKTDLEAITALHHQPPSPLGSLQLVQHVHAFLLEVIRCSHRPARARRTDSLQPVLDYIAGHLEETLRVPELAARARLSPARFNLRFKEETGVPPAEYVLRARVAEARQRLERGGRTITEIAFDLGFSSSQYFATAFRRLQGISPREVRRCG